MQRRPPLLIYCHGRPAGHLFLLDPPAPAAPTRSRARGKRINEPVARWLAARARQPGRNRTAANQPSPSVGARDGDQTEAGAAAQATARLTPTAQIVAWTGSRSRRARPSAAALAMTVTRWAGAGAAAAAPDNYISTAAMTRRSRSFAQSPRFGFIPFGGTYAVRLGRLLAGGRARQMRMHVMAGARVRTYVTGQQQHPRTSTSRPSGEL